MHTCTHKNNPYLNSINSGQYFFCLKKIRRLDEEDFSALRLSCVDEKKDPHRYSNRIKSSGIRTRILGISDRRLKPLDPPPTNLPTGVNYPNFQFFRALPQHSVCCLIPVYFDMLFQLNISQTISCTKTSIVEGFFIRHSSQKPLKIKSDNEQRYTDQILKLHPMREDFQNKRRFEKT